MKRSLLVIALLLLGTGVPCALWFVSGSREAEREAARVTDGARAEAQATAQTAAEQLAVRLEKIRASESDRPYFQYQNLMHDPRGASQGLSVVPSPLAQGPVEPLILAHFQIDAKGTVTMPTLNDEVHELNAPDVARQQAIRNALTAAAPQLMAAGGPRLVSLQSEVATRAKPVQQVWYATEPVQPLWQAASRVQPIRQAETSNPPPTPPSTQTTTAIAATTSAAPAEIASATMASAPAPIPPPRVTRTDMLQNSSANSANTSNVYQFPQQQIATLPKAAEPKAFEPKTKEQPAKVQKLDSSAFAQNAQSNAVYNELKLPRRSATVKRATIPARQEPEVEIATREFAWSFAVVGGNHTLAALRPVVTPNGAVVQGFLISDAAVRDLLRNNRYVRLQAGVGTFPIGDTGWSLDVDEQAAAGASLNQANEVRSAFRRTFYGGLAAASLAIIAVAVLVWRTEKLARERAQFAAAAAHELRTPLAGLRLYGDMLAHQLGDPERSRVYAQHVSDEADRLGRVVANMLEFTRLERGSLTVKPEPGDLGGAVGECVEQLRPALEVAGCSVALTVANDLPPVAFDRDAVHHIVQNLLDNAEKYSRPSTDRRVDIDVARANGHAVVTVSDRGVGLDARTARHLFLPFERGTAGAAPAGLGLGLVLVKALAEAHGGDVSWAARNGGGTSFCVRLPAFYTP